MAHLITPDGVSKRITPKNGKHFTLEELQELVGGLIEVVGTPDPRRIMVINEEGKLMDLAPNLVATALFGFRDTIVGNAVTGTEYELFGPQDGD